METLIAILIVLGLLSASGVLPEKSPRPANQQTQPSALEASEPGVRPACNQHDPAYRDLTVPYPRRTSSDPADNMEAACDV
ncbi:MAG: hypothetical protein U5S82_16475 [Gammaproteobacteria bacterium]|nr:hypothetical protein [Gammaproteobacteria bacterium]